MDYLKARIIQTLPDDRSEISWGLNELVKYCLKIIGEKIPQMIHPKFSPTIYDIFKIIMNDNIYPNKNDKYELYIYLMINRQINYYNF